MEYVVTTKAFENCKLKEINGFSFSNFEDAVSATRNILKVYGNQCYSMLDEKGINMFSLKMKKWVR